MYLEFHYSVFYALPTFTKNEQWLYRLRSDSLKVATDVDSKYGWANSSCPFWKGYEYKTWPLYVPEANYYGCYLKCNFKTDEAVLSKINKKGLKFEGKNLLDLFTQLKEIITLENKRKQIIHAYLSLSKFASQRNLILPKDIQDIILDEALDTTNLLPESIKRKLK